MALVNVNKWYKLLMIYVVFSEIYICSSCNNKPKIISLDEYLQSTSTTSSPETENVRYDTLEYGDPPKWYIAGSREPCHDSAFSLEPESPDSTRGVCRRMQQYFSLSGVARKVCAHGLVYSRNLQTCIKKGKPLMF
ncbi:unnamed protein product [Orchesella dallaii]|uniref:Chitin-binding type-2 domain-containing protein n=1 Tax=Orchesella dallaii TaxID=48710 RepID=A0ABP1S060_9HEXA